MKIKPLPAIGIIAIALVIGVVGRFALNKPPTEPVRIYKASVPAQKVGQQATALTQTQKDEEAQEEVQQTRDRMLATLGALGVKTDEPYWQDFAKVLESPAFAEYQKAQAKRAPGTNLSLWWDFLESQGRTSGRIAQERRFREHFPTGDYADYEPMMRQRLAALFLAAEPPEEGTTAFMHTLNIMTEFRREDDAQRVWMRGHFNGYDGDLAWADEVRQNAASIVAEATQMSLDPAPGLPVPSATPPNLTDVSGENREMAPESAAVSGDTPSFGVLVPLPETIEDVETELLEQFGPETPELPRLPTEADFETVLREQLPPSRFQSAMQILDHYGLEAGLQHLRIADPEVAARLERLIQQKQEEE